MINPIKRIWVPKKAPEQAQPASSVPPPATKALAGTQPTSARGALFDELPSPEMEEKNSDSIWAAFDSVRAQEIERK
jgi:hypothetical protein